ncbi:MAG TPA: hypothetical protein VM099_06715 [Gemmatimonadaceae bacterium]|nr:hypothetical protein [Gemmatimonadaceae bacterium]
MGRIPWADLKLALLTSILVLAAYVGVVQGFNDAHSARDVAERVTAFAELGYGILGGLALNAILRRKRFARPILEFWGAIFVATMILSPVVAGHATPLKGAGIGAAAAGLVALTIWLWGSNHIAVPQRATPTSVVDQPPAPVIERVDRWDRELAELRVKMKEMDARHISGPQQIPGANPA